MNILQVARQGKEERSEENPVQCWIYKKYGKPWYCPDPEKEEDCQRMEEKLKYNEDGFSGKEERFLSLEQYSEFSFSQ